MGTPVRVVFVGGYARTGSTLLDRLLGRIEGFASFGELRHVWERGFRGNQLCGCGRPFRECPFWNDVVAAAFGGWGGVDPVAVGRDERRVDTVWSIPRMLSGGWTAGFRGAFERYLGVVGALYRGMAEVSGARFLVDSTKDPQHLYVLRQAGLDVRVAHLVRDSRAVAFSWRRVRRRPEITWRHQDMPRFPVVRSAMAWDVANLAAEASRLLGPYAFIRYEDLVRDPAGRLARLARELGLGDVDLSFLDGHSASLRPAHTVAGNPVRFAEGTIELRADTEWTTAMPTGQRSLVTALTLPLLAHYGYRR
ncbi:MAG TPA: sulfotransferase [Actinomycetota bacterium]|jgi:hypothetical protein